MGPPKEVSPSLRNTHKTSRGEEICRAFTTVSCGYSSSSATALSPFNYGLA